MDNEKEHREYFMKKLLRDKWNLTSMLISVIAGILTFLVFPTESFFRESENTSKEKENELSIRIKQLQIELINKDKQIQDLLKKTYFYTDSIKSFKKSSDYYLLINKIEATNLKLDKLNEIIIDNPEKALSLPLLKKDIQNLKDDLMNSSNSQKEEIARVFDINKWIIGLVFSMIVSVIILNISNLTKTRKE